MYARRPKESHRDTVTYEIEMLEFCIQKLTGENGRDGNEEALYLEGFLLHYRNLIHFFSGNHHRDDDLSTADSHIWAGREMTPGEVATIRDPAKALDTDYHVSISKYLQHCTRVRHERDKAWDVATMKRRIDPIITEFERVFPR